MRWKLEHNTTGRNYQDQKQKLQKRHYSGCNTAVWDDNKCNKGVQRVLDASQGYHGEPGAEAIAHLNYSIVCRKPSNKKKRRNVKIKV